MSLFGDSTPDESAASNATDFAAHRPSLFDDDPPVTRSTSTALFADDDDAGSNSPWDMPTPRRQQTRADPDLMHNPPPAESPRTNGHRVPSSSAQTNGDSLHGGPSPQSTSPRRTVSTYTSSMPPSGPGSVADSGNAWGSFDGTSASGAGAGFADQATNPTSPFGGSGVSREPGAGQRPGSAANRTIGGGRTGPAVEETITVTLMPEKEGIFLFQHHNYEVASSRRGSKVIRRYSDFVWLLDCLHKRYPFRALPLLPPKRVAGWWKEPHAALV